MVRIIHLPEPQTSPSLYIYQGYVDLYIYCVVFYYSEQCLISARASVVLYDDIYKKWVPSGSLPTGISKVQILHEPTNKTYRVVARKIQDKEV